MDKDKDTETALPSLGSLSLHTMAKAAPGPGSEPAASSGSRTWMAGTQGLELPPAASLGVREQEPAAPSRAPTGCQGPSGHLPPPGCA